MRNNSVWGVVRDVLARNRAKTVFLAVTALASVLLALLPPQIMRAVIDRCLTPGLPDGLLGSAWPTMHASLGAAVSAAGTISLVICLGTIVSSLMTDRLVRRLGAGGRRSRPRPRRGLSQPRRRGR